MKLPSGIGRRRAAAKADKAPNYEKRRKEISEAAARVFNRKGFSGTSIRRYRNNRGQTVTDTVKSIIGPALLYVHVPELKVNRRCDDAVNEILIFKLLIKSNTDGRPYILMKNQSL